MSFIRKTALVAVATGMLVGGCAVAARTGALQPPPVKSRLSITLHQAGGMQLGIDVDWYAWPAEDVTTQAAETVAYVNSLNANAISISFPFFMNGTSSTQVRSHPSTPTPAQLSILVEDARRLGMTVSLRPLLANGSIHRSRTGWKPVNEAAWFSSYKRFLRPYLILAQNDHVAEFIEGAEFAAFDTAPGWRSLSNWAKTLYHGTLACAANFSNVPRSICGGITETVDAYPRVKDGSLKAGWDNYDKTLRKGTALSEVGIAAAPEAPTKPFEYHWRVSKPDPAVQASWFTAACYAAQREHLSGIYFWSIGIGPPPLRPTVADQLSWGGAGAGAIASCFRNIARAKT